MEVLNELALFAEQAMGWPITWTELRPLEMDKFQQWQRAHGISC